MKKEISSEVKIIWLSRMYYGVTNSYDLNVNPYDDLTEFLNASISSLNWGKDKLLYREKFCKKYQMLLDLYNIKISLNNIMKELNEKGQTNRDAVARWAQYSEFPKNW